MPQVGNKKFPYTPSGIARANAIKKQLMGGSMKQDKMYRPDRDGMKRPIGIRPLPRPKPSARPGMGRRPMVPPRGPNKNKAWGRNPRPRKPKMIRYL